MNVEVKRADSLRAGHHQVEFFVVYLRNAKIIRKKLKKKRRLLFASAYLTVAVYIDLVNEALDLLNTLHLKTSAEIYV